MTIACSGDSATWTTRYRTGNRDALRGGLRAALASKITPGQRGLVDGLGLVAERIDTNTVKLFRVLAGFEETVAPGGTIEMRPRIAKRPTATWKRDERLILRPIEQFG